MHIADAHCTLELFLTAVVGLQVRTGTVTTQRSMYVHVAYYASRIAVV